MSEPEGPSDGSPISDYALIGDTRSTALIDRSGSIDWLCWPRHDSPALFLRLLDTGRGGACRIEPEGLVASSRRYLPDTNILETRFVTATGTLLLTDLMPLRAAASLGSEGPDGESEGRLIRLLTCDAGRVSGRLSVRPTFDYARQAGRPRPDPRQGGAGGVVFDGAGQTLRATASHTLRIDADCAVADWSLGAGEQGWLALTHGEGEAAHPEGIEDVRARLEQTRRYWEGWSRGCTYDGPYRATVLRSALCLKLLTFAPSGAIIAAPTASLPEAVPGDRNFDYRFAWLRDASFTVTSFVSLGFAREAAEYLRFLRHADPSRGREPRLMYGIDGPQAAAETLGHLRGWQGIGPVTIGNDAESQSQLDIYGEVLAALHFYLERVEYDPPQKVNDHLPETITNLVENVIRRRHDPDHGLWELRGPTRHMLHSKGMNRVALDCAIAIGERTGRIDPPTLARWRRHAEEITADYMTHGWNAARGAYTMSYGSDVLDSAVLRLVLFGALSPDDPRIEATLAAIEAELASGDLLRRYRMPDGMHGEEATFLACSFWRASVLAMMRRTDEARACFERLLACGNDLGLFAEEFDAATGESRGNFPQAFTHMALIQCAMRLGG